MGILARLGLALTRWTECRVPDSWIIAIMLTLVVARWWVHRKWIEELYDLRSKSVHKGTGDGRTWGWEPSEHLVMAAWVFPLVVKLLLQRDGHYTLSDHDESRCLAVDKLLAITGWHKEMESDTGQSKWHEIVSSTTLKHQLERITQQITKENTSLFPEVRSAEDC